MVTRSHAVAGRNVQKTIPQDRNFFMRHAIMRACEHARRAPSADPAARAVATEVAVTVEAMATEVVTAAVE